LTQDDIGTHFVERDVGQLPITLVADAQLFKKRWV
jgi:hypothetical protein